MTTTRTATWTAIETDNGYALCMDGEIVRDGFTKGEADERAHKANAAEITAGRLARTERF
jgi:hypothetical protein